MTISNSSSSSIISPTAMSPAYGYLVLLCIPLITVFGNGLMILAVLIDKKLQMSVTNRYTAALAFADLLIGLIPMPFAVYVKVNGDHWDLGVALCRFYTAFDVASSTASILHLVLISGDRYLAVMWPHEYQRYAKHAKVSFPIILVWLISATLSIPIVMGKSILNAESCWLENPEYMLYSSLLSFYIPASVLTMMYIKIFRRLNRHKGIRSMLRASGAVCGTNTGAPFHLPLVVVQEVSYAQPTIKNNNDKGTGGKVPATTSTSLHPPKGHSDSRVSPNFGTSQKSNRIADQACTFSAALTTPRMMQKSKTCPLLTQCAQLPAKRREKPDGNVPMVKNLRKEMRTMTINEAFKAEDDFPDIDDDHACFPLWSQQHESLKRHHPREKDGDGRVLLPCPSITQSKPPVKRSISTMIRRPCVVATRRLSLWLAGSDSQEFGSTGTVATGSLAALDIAESKLRSTDSRRYLDTLHACSSRSRLLSNHFDSDAWGDDSSLANSRRIILDACVENGKPSFDPALTEVYTLPFAMASRASGTLRKLATRLTTALVRKTDKQTMAKEKKATKLVAMILGTCGVFIISWLPFFTFNSMRGICLSVANSASDCDWLPSELFFLTTWLGYANSGFNPIIYGLVNEHFRTTYKKILRWPSKNRCERWNV